MGSSAAPGSATAGQPDVGRRSWLQSAAGDREGKARIHGAYRPLSLSIKTMLDLHRLRLLKELHTRGTLAAVAAALGYSSSAVSQQLALLEKEAGAPLLERVGRGVRLTPQALILVGHAEVVLDRLEQAEAEIEASLTAPTGVVRLAAFQTAMLSLM